MVRNYPVRFHIQCRTLMPDAEHFLASRTAQNASGLGKYFFPTRWCHCTLLVCPCYWFEAFPRKINFTLWRHPVATWLEHLWLLITVLFISKTSDSRRSPFTINRNDCALLYPVPPMGVQTSNLFILGSNCWRL